VAPVSGTIIPNPQAAEIVKAMAEPAEERDQRERDQRDKRRQKSLDALDRAYAAITRNSQ
jgi:hypothetical protein